MSDVGARAQSILDYLAGRRDAMVEMLVSLACKESPTDVVASQAACNRSCPGHCLNSASECGTSRVERRVGTCSRCLRGASEAGPRSC